MSYTYLQEQGEESSAESFSDIPQYVLSRLNLTAGKSCCNDNETESCHGSPSGMTLRRSTGGPGEGELMWYAGDSPVRTYLPQGRAKELREPALDCGPSLSGSLAKYNPASYSWRTAQCSLFGGLEEFSETWPRWGMMHDGECLAQMQPGVVRSANVSGLWPTILKADAYLACYPHRSFARNHSISSLPEFVSRLFLMRICPLTSESIMRWPDGWTDLRPLVMDKIQRWLDSHGKS